MATRTVGAACPNRPAGKKPRAAVLFLYDIGNSGVAWQQVIHDLPDDMRLTTIDLLGFEQSKRPVDVVADLLSVAMSILIHKRGDRKIL